MERFFRSLECSGRLGVMFCAAVFLCLPGCAGGGDSGTEGKPPPNILWITCEDIGPALGCYGDRYARTPVIDRLAGEGVLYTRAYATAPICAPARSTLITGIYATALGTQHLRSDIPVPDDLMILPEYLSEAGYFCSNNAKTDYNFSPEGRWDDLGGKAHWRHRQEGQPFFSVFNFGITHEGPVNRMDESDVAPLKERHDPGLAVLPPYYPDTPEMRRIWARQYDLVSVLDMEVDTLLRQLKDDGLYENTIVFFFSDHGFGLPRYKRWLFRSGLHVPLIVRVPDAYRSLIRKGPGSREDRLVSFVDLAPSVLAIAGLPVPERMQGMPFLGQEQAERNYVFGARSRADDVYDVSRCVLDGRYIYIRNFRPHQPYIREAIIFGDQKAGFRELRRCREEGILNVEAMRMWEPKPYQALFDLVNDPYELENLVGEPRFSGVVERMRDTLYGWITGHRDVGLLHESEMMIRSASSSPFEVGHSNAYDAERILDAANMCGAPGISPDEIGPLMQHAEPAVRYWGVVALQAYDGDRTVALPWLESALKDDSPAVSIAAAELLLRDGHGAKAFPVVEAHLRKSEDPWVVLQAAIALRRSGSKAKPMIPVIEEVYPAYRGEIWGRYRDWLYSMFIGFALDQVYLNCGLEIPE